MVLHQYLMRNRDNAQHRERLNLDVINAKVLHLKVATADPSLFATSSLTTNNDLPLILQVLQVFYDQSSDDM